MCGAGCRQVDRLLSPDPAKIGAISFSIFDFQTKVVILEMSNSDSFTCDSSVDFGCNGNGDITPQFHNSETSERSHNSRLTSPQLSISCVLFRGFDQFRFLVCFHQPFPRAVSTSSEWSRKSSKESVAAVPKFLIFSISRTFDDSSQLRWSSFEIKISWLPSSAIDTLLAAESTAWN